MAVRLQFCGSSRIQLHCGFNTPVKSSRKKLGSVVGSGGMAVGAPVEVGDGRLVKVAIGFSTIFSDDGGVDGETLHAERKTNNNTAKSFFTIRTLL